MLALRRHSRGLPGGPASSPPPSAHPFSPKGGTREPRPAGADARACVAVLTWDGAVSAVSRDAVRDSAVARSATVLDDWDDAFDRGKVRRGPSPRRAAGWGRSREDAASLGSVVQWPRTSHPVQALLGHCERRVAAGEAVAPGGFCGDGGDGGHLRRRPEQWVCGSRRAGRVTPARGTGRPFSGIVTPVILRTGKEN